MEIGKKLKDAREKQNLTLDQVQEKTKIRKKYLKAIEHENFDLIPGRVYAKVFIKGYANEVGLNGNELSQEYQIWLDKLEKEEKENKIEEESKQKITFFNKKSIIIILLIIIALASLLIYNIFLADSFQTLNNNNNNIIEINSSSRDSNTVSQIEYNNTEPENKKDPTENNTEKNNITNKKTIKIIATEKSWLQVNVDKKKVFQGFIEKDETKLYSGEKNVQLKIGNGIAVKVEKNNKIFGPWGKKGEVIEKKITF